jgi:hypothetical protein
MRIASSTLFAALSVTAAVALGCGRSSNPAGPSEQSGATIAGTITGGYTTASSLTATTAGLTAAAAPSGITVSLVGTDRSAAVDISGRFHIEGVPAGNVQLQFAGGGVNATLSVSGVGDQELVTLEVSLSATSATVVSDVRTSGKVSLCHKEGNGSYHMIDVSVNAEPAHRDHGDGAVGDRVPADPTKVFGSSCQLLALSVRIEKSTNGEDADEAPGPTVNVGSAVNWRYVVTNPSQLALTNVRVVDDRNVTVTCPQTTLAAGQSMTCTGSGVAAAGQYRNVGTVTADSSAGEVKDSDPSHYFGLAPSTGDDGPKIKICHRTGNGSYHLIDISVNAEPAHRAHGDAKVGEAVPGNQGKTFSASCTVQ